MVVVKIIRLQEIFLIGGIMINSRVGEGVDRESGC